MNESMQIYSYEVGAYSAAAMIAGITRPSQCPAPRKKQIVESASAPLKCDTPATVVTWIPVTDRATGQHLLQLGKTCLDHSIEIASWKAIQMLLVVDSQKPRRIVAA
ncbi:MAG: hypothetical protein ABI539_01670 [Acidobacteriota bacterium]